MLGKSAQEEQFQPCWCVHYDLFWANSPVPTSTPVIAWELRWVKKLKNVQIREGGRKADTTAKIWLWPQNNKLSKV